MDEEYVPKHRANVPMTLIPQREHVDALQKRSREAALRIIECEIVAEMHRTEENIEFPTHEDYAADIARRLDRALRS